MPTRIFHWLLAALILFSWWSVKNDHTDWHIWSGIAILTYLIRAFGAFPDGIAFAVLLMNICVPLIDMKTQPPVFGHREDKAQ